MKDLNRVQIAISRATRGMLLVDAALTVGLVAVVALSSLIPAGPGGSAAPAHPGDIAGKETAHLTAQDVRKITTGKILFRTSALILKEKVVDELAHYELKGISLRNGVYRAFVRDNKLKKFVTKTVGESLGAYEIVDISDEGVTVKRGAETVILSKG